MTDKTIPPETSGPFGLQWAARQAVANARIEGFVPDADFERDFRRVLSGEISKEEFLELSLQAAQRIAGAKGNSEA